MRIVILFSIVYALGVQAAEAQAGPRRGGSEWQLWGGGGHAINGVQSSDSVWNVGVRYGLVLSAPHGPSILRGQLEYAVDVVPVFVVRQKTNNAYGFGINPFAFKWDFAEGGRVVPYVEIGGGTLFTNVKVPERTSRVNFTSGGALGIHFTRRRYNWSAEVRFMHISNAGLGDLNPGINSIQGRVGFGLFSQPR